jgi:hypothetical protein
VGGGEREGVCGGGGGGGKRERERLRTFEILYICIYTYLVCLSVYTRHDLLEQLPIKLGGLVEVLAGKSHTSVLQHI